MAQTVIMDKDDIGRAVNKLAAEIVDKNKGTKDLVIIGIRTRGVPLATRLAETIEKMENVKLETGLLDITLYRDDIGQTDKLPVLKKTEIPFNIYNKTIVLVDDVLFTGRTIRAALDAIIDFGRPKKIQLCVLVDRDNRELPIRADFVSKKLTTAYDDNVTVHFQEIDGEDKVFLKAK
jgi:pyrimidine operon attenuation protein / uracil phosphoribosyltransferase